MVPALPCLLVHLPATCNRYARSHLTDQQLRDKLRPRLEGPDEAKDEFLRHISYVSGPYDGAEGWQTLEREIETWEEVHPCCPAGRLYYLALPPSIYPQVRGWVVPRAAQACPRPSSPVRSFLAWQVLHLPAGRCMPEWCAAR